MTIDSAEVNLMLAKAAFEGQLNRKRIPEDDVQYGETRLAAVVSDLDCSPSLLMQGARLIQRHGVLGGDWRKYAELAFKNRKNPDKTYLAYLYFEILCKDTEVTPAEVREWAHRAHLEEGRIVSARAHTALRHLAVRFTQTKAREMFPGYANGKPDAARLGSVRSIYRLFWKLASQKNDMSKALKKMLDSEHPPAALSEEIQPILHQWHAFDNDSPENWPMGVIEYLGNVMNDTKQWQAFFNSYTTYFPEVTTLTPPPSATPQ